MLIRNREFVDAMKLRWTNAYKNTSNLKLEAIWMKMADVYGTSLANDVKAWRVLQPEAGTGKSTGCALYLAMHGQRVIRSDWINPANPGERPGVLLVSRTIQQCEELVRDINATAGVEVAITKHSENEVTAKACLSYPVVVLTHASFTNTYHVFKSSDEMRAVAQSWVFGGQTHPRRLTIVDEALVNVIGHDALSSNELHQLLAWTPPGLQTTFSDIWDGLKTLLGYFDKLKQGGNDKLAWEEGKARSLLALPKTMNDERLDQFTALLLHHKFVDRTTVKNTMLRIKRTLQTFAWWSARGGDGALNIGQLLVDSDLPSPVMLDGTASQNIMLHLLDVKPEPLPTARSYANATLHVARVKGGVGKTAMKTFAEARVDRLLRWFDKEPREGDTLLITHKVVRDYAEKVFAGRVAHANWNGIDGKNDWKDFSRVVLVGLPYRDNQFTTSAVVALRGPQDSDWFHSEEGFRVRNDLRVMYLTASIVQAINRIRIRRVIDGRGNCPTCEVFLTLPEGFEGDSLLDAITKELPGINIKPWSFTFNDEADEVEASLAKLTMAQRVIGLMKALPNGKYKIGEIARLAEIDEGNLANFRKKLRTKTRLRDELAQLGVNYASEGQGKASYLVKA